MHSLRDSRTGLNIRVSCVATHTQTSIELLEHPESSISHNAGMKDDQT